jgi:hypothetical protein
LCTYYKEKYLRLIKKNKYNIHDDDIYDNYETRHSTEPNKPIITINFQDKVFFLPKSQLQRSVMTELNKTVNYNSNNLNTSILISPKKSIGEKKKKSFRKMNKTFAVDKFSDKGISFLDMLNGNHLNKDKLSDRIGITPRELNTSTQPETTVRRNLNDTFVLKSNRSSDNVLKKQVLNLVK